MDAATAGHSGSTKGRSTESVKPVRLEMRLAIKTQSDYRVSAKTHPIVIIELVGYQWALSEATTSYSISLKSLGSIWKKRISVIGLQLARRALGIQDISEY